MASGMVLHMRTELCKNTIVDAHVDSFFNDGIYSVFSLINDGIYSVFSLISTYLFEEHAIVRSIATVPISVSHKRDHCCIETNTHIWKTAFALYPISHGLE